MPGREPAESCHSTVLVNLTVDLISASRPDRNQIAHQRGRVSDIVRRLVSARNNVANKALEKEVTYLRLEDAILALNSAINDNVEYI